MSPQWILANLGNRNETGIEKLGTAPSFLFASPVGFALPLLAAFSCGIIGTETATAIIGVLVSSTALTLLVVPIVNFLFDVSIPSLSRETSWGKAVSHPCEADDS